MGDGTFRPKDAVTRAQAATIGWNGVLGRIEVRTEKEASKEK